MSGKEVIRKKLQDLNEKCVFDSEKIDARISKIRRDWADLTEFQSPSQPFWRRAQLRLSRLLCRLLLPQALLQDRVNALNRFSLELILDRQQQLIDHVNRLASVAVQIDNFWMEEADRDAILESKVAEHDSLHLQWQQAEQDLRKKWSDLYRKIDDLFLLNSHQLVLSDEISELRQRMLKLDATENAITDRPDRPKSR